MIVVGVVVGDVGDVMFVCVCVCVCVSLCTKNEGNEGRAEGSGKKVSSYKWNIYNRSFLLFAREEDGAIISLVKCKHD